MPASPFAPAPSLTRSADGTSIAAWPVLSPEGDVRGEAAPPEGARPPLLLVHGAAADHTTWRAAGPLLTRGRRVLALDRRGRGASGDADPAGYSIEREYEDVAAVADALGAPVDVAGHSYGGRVALGAALRSPAVRRVVVYEGAPVPAGMSYRPPGLVGAVRAALERGDNEGALATFLQRIVGLSDEALAAYRREAVWPARVAAAPTILREIESEATPAAGLEAFGGVSVPVLLILGSISRSPFRIGTDALAAALPNARVAVIDGAAHAAHHTHVPELVSIVTGFLDG